MREQFRPVIQIIKENRVEIYIEKDIYFEIEVLPNCLRIKACELAMNMGGISIIPKADNEIELRLDYLK